MPNLRHENIHGRTRGLTICGIDEVGRGPLAGPVVAAALVIPDTLCRKIRRRIRDSKALSAEEREALYAPLTDSCPYAIAEASVAEIAELNILWASMLAMQRAAAALPAACHAALVDGNRAPRLPVATHCIVRGDALSLSIAAASIIAKVHRDRLMRRLADAHPHYGWERNAGYGTPQHLQGIATHGVTIWHREAFAPIRAARAAQAASA